MSFKTAVLKQQARLRRPLLHQFGFPDEYLTDGEYVERIRSLVRKYESVLCSIPKDHKDRKTLGVKKQILSQELFFLSKRRGKPGKSLANCFMECAQRELPKEQFDFLKELALIEQEKLFKLKGV